MITTPANSANSATMRDGPTISRSTRTTSSMTVYLMNFCLDLELHEAPMRQAALEIIAPTGWSTARISAAATPCVMTLTDGLGISDADLNKIRYQNALKLLHLDPAS